MKDEKLQGALRQAPPPFDPAHRDRLEAELLERFDARRPARAPRRSPTWRQLSVAAALVALGITTQVPAEYQVEVGKRVTLRLARPVAVPGRASFGDALVGPGGRLVDLRVQARRTPEGAALVIDVWGDRLVDDATVVERLRAMPEFADARIEVSPYTGRVHDTLIGKLGYALFQRGASAEEREAARQQVIAHLREVAGEDAQIDVEVEEEGGAQRIRARVLKRGEVPEEPPAPPER